MTISDVKEIDGMGIPNFGEEGMARLQVRFRAQSHG